MNGINEKIDKYLINERMPEYSEMKKLADKKLLKTMKISMNNLYSSLVEKGIPPMAAGAFIKVYVNQIYEKF